MDPQALADVDRQIAQLKKELNALFGRRIAILHDEIRRSEAEAQALSVASGQLPGQAKAKRPRPPKQAPSAADPDVAATAAVKSGAGPAEPASASPAPDKEPAPAPEQKRSPKAAAAGSEDSLLEALREAGLFGMTQAELGRKTGLGAQAVTRRLKDLPGVTRKGTGKEARYYLKV